MNGNGLITDESLSGECSYGFILASGLKRLCVSCLHECNKVKLLCNKVVLEYNKVKQICATKLNFCATLLYKSTIKFTQHEQIHFAFFQ